MISLDNLSVDKMLDYFKNTENLLFKLGLNIIIPNTFFAIVLIQIEIQY